MVIRVTIRLRTSPSRPCFADGALGRPLSATRGRPPWRRAQRATTNVGSLVATLEAGVRPR